jgi:Microcystin-dependent protein
MGNHEKAYAICDSGCRVEVLPLEYMAGMIIQYAGEYAPKGFFICDGREVSRETYEDLFKIIGTTYGSGDGSKTFNIPNLKGRVPVGLDKNDNDFKMLGNTGGEKEHQLKIDEIPSHNHKATTVIESAGSHIHEATSSSNGSHSHTVSGTANSAGSHGHSTYYLTDLTNNKGDSRRRGVESANSGNSADNVIAGGSHSHTVSGTTNSVSSHTHTITVKSGGSHIHGATTNVENTGGGKAHNNLQPYIVLNYIIKF